MNYLDEFKLAFLKDTPEGRERTLRLCRKFLNAEAKSLRNDDQKPRQAFVPPTVDDVRAYVRQMRYGMDPQAFCDFYGSKGWKVGNSPMQDWKCAVRGWESRDKASRPNRPVNADSYGEKWAEKTAARREQHKKEEQQARETLASIWEEAAKIKGVTND